MICPDGHEMPAEASRCPECGRSVTGRARRRFGVIVGAVAVAVLGGVFALASTWRDSEHPATGAAVASSPILGQTPGGCDVLDATGPEGISGITLVDPACFAETLIAQMCAVPLNEMYLDGEFPIVTGQVRVDGYRLADGRALTLRRDGSGTAIIMCQDGKPNDVDADVMAALGDIVTDKSADVWADTASWRFPYREFDPTAQPDAATAPSAQGTDATPLERAAPAVSPQEAAQLFVTAMLTDGDAGAYAATPEAIFDFQDQADAGDEYVFVSCVPDSRSSTGGQLCDFTGTSTTLQLEVGQYGQDGIWTVGAVYGGFIE